MSNVKSKDQKFWQQALINTELKVMSGTLSQLDSVISNDDTTATQLAGIILQDVALTTRVLTIANSVQHMPSQSTSSGNALVQAIVRIGFQGLRAICISTAILDTAIKKLPHHPELLSCILQSFNVAVHARNIARKMNADADQAFIAGLLHNIGEMAFWCSTIPQSKPYMELLRSGIESSYIENPEQTLKELSGLDFYEFSKVLANQWGLEEVLSESLDGASTDGSKAIYIGRRISQAIQDGWDSPAINKVLNEYLTRLDLDIMSAMKFMRDGDGEAKSLASKYEVLTSDQSEVVESDTEQKDKAQKNKRASQTKHNKSSMSSSKKQDTKKPTSIIRS